MAEWHGYFVVERENIGAVNWASLQNVFENMGTHLSPFPAYNNHKRTRLDGDAVIYESNFDTSEVTLSAFIQLLADEFSVDPGDIETSQSVISYGDYNTSVWNFNYPIGGDLRFIVRRFGQGEAWPISRNECVGYVILNLAQWE